METSVDSLKIRKMEKKYKKDYNVRPSKKKRTKKKRRHCFTHLASINRLIFFVLVIFSPYSFKNSVYNCNTFVLNINGNNREKENKPDCNGMVNSTLL